MSVFSALFGQKKKSIEDHAKEWRTTMRSEQRKLDRQITNIQRAENKTRLEAKNLAKKGENDAVKILAKELVQSKKAVQRLYTAKAQMNSVKNALDCQLAEYKMAGSFKKSAEMLSDMNKLVRLDEVSNTMRTMQMEMMKADMIQEQMDDVADGLMDEDSDDVEEEVGNIIEQITEEALRGAQAGRSRLPEKQKQKEKEKMDEEEGEQRDELEARLAALRG